MIGEDMSESGRMGKPCTTLWYRGSRLRLRIKYKGSKIYEERDFTAELGFPNPLLWEQTQSTFEFIEFRALNRFRVLYS